MVTARRPDVVIVDIRMPPTHTDEGLPRRPGDPPPHPQIGVLVLSHYLESRVRDASCSRTHPRGPATC